MLATAQPASAYPFATWANPGSFNFVVVDGYQNLAGRGDSRMASPADPTQCDNAKNDSGNANGGNIGTPRQSSGYDFQGAGGNANCAALTDDDEVTSGQQNRVLTKFTATVNANGSYAAAPAPTFSAPTLNLYTNAATPTAVNGVTSVALTGTITAGSINPANGSASVTFNPMTANISVPVLGACTVNIPNLTLTTGTDGAYTGSPYDPNTGLMTVVNGTFPIPDPGTAGSCGTVKGAFGLPAASGVSSIRFVVRVLPNAATTQPTPGVVTPTSGTEGAQVTLTPAATAVTATPLYGTGQVPVPTPAPTYNWRWVQTGGPVVADSTLLTGPLPPDTGTNQRLLNNVNDLTGAATFQVPSCPVGQVTCNITFNVYAGDGAVALTNTTTGVGPVRAVTFTVNNAAPVVVSPTPLTASAGATQLNNPVKLTATISDGGGPTQIDTSVGNAPAWSLGANSCSGAPTIGAPVNTPAGSNTWVSTFAPVGTSDCSFTATLTAKDKAGQTGSQAVTVNVKATTSGQIKGTVTACTPGCAPLATGAVLAFPFTAPTTFGAPIAATVTAGSYTITGATNGTNYKLLFSGSGVSPAWWGGFTTSSNTKPLVAPFAGADQTLYGGTAAGGSITGAANSVTTYPSGNVANGTPVRLYDSAGAYVAKTTTTTGGFTFTGLKTGAYKVQFAKGSATYDEVWANLGRSLSGATPIQVTSPNSTAVTAQLPLIRPAAWGTTMTYEGGVATGGGGNNIQDTSKAWAANQWNGFRALCNGYECGGQVRTISATSATQITVSSNFVAQSVLCVLLGNCPPCASGTPIAGSSYSILPKAFAGNPTSNVAAGATTLTDTSQDATSWPAGSLVGATVEITCGLGAGQTRTITANTNTQITVTPAFTTAFNSGNVSTYKITPSTANMSGNLAGLLTQARNGAALPGGTNKEVRVYNAATGAFVGKTTVTTQIANEWNGWGNFTFLKWNGGGGNISGLVPGNYKVLYRMVGGGGGSPAFCSQWSGGGAGGVSSGSWASASSVAIAAGQETTTDVAILQDAACATTS